MRACPNRETEWFDLSSYFSFIENFYVRPTFELSGAALPRPVEREARNELERVVMFDQSLLLALRIEALEVLRHDACVGFRTSNKNRDIGY
jgi:hypothetical protein